MSITIVESNMEFGPFEENAVIYWENSKLVTSFGKGLKCVEFICLKDNAFRLIEAKASAPNPNGIKGQQGFDEYIADISDKFAHTIELFFASYIKRYADKNGEIPVTFLNQNVNSVKISAILVVKNADEKWLRGIQDALSAVLNLQRKIWGFDVAVLNEDKARAYKLIT